MPTRKCANNGATQNMPTEIEHKYLVDNQKWTQVTTDKSVKIRQGYILPDLDKSVRIRTFDHKGYITIKGKNIGASRPEYEYEIPLEDANELLELFCSGIIEKTRHYVVFENKTWEVDVFEGLNAGLIVAEIELKDKDESYVIPDWADAEVTNDEKYANPSLSIKPYNTWFQINKHYRRY